MYCVRRAGWVSGCMACSIGLGVKGEWGSVPDTYLRVLCRCAQVPNRSSHVFSFPLSFSVHLHIPFLSLPLSEKNSLYVHIHLSFSSRSLSLLTTSLTTLSLSTEKYFPLILFFFFFFVFSPNCCILSPVVWVGIAFSCPFQVIPKLIATSFTFNGVS